LKVRESKEQLTWIDRIDRTQDRDEGGGMRDEKETRHLSFIPSPSALIPASSSCLSMFE
jgi:hypothetical protein